MSQPKRGRPLPAALATLAALSAAVSAHATEGGGSLYPNGIENFTMAAAPPPGTYLLLYSLHMEADQLRDNSGDRVPVGFRLRASGITPRLVVVTPNTLLGGQPVFHVIAPLVSLDVSLAGKSDSRQGLGDMTFGAGLAYHLSPRLHAIVALDVFAPTGQYDQNRLANIGRNYWSAEPVFGISYLQPSGFNADLKVMYDFNGRNAATGYRSGQELHADFALGWGLGNGWTLGAGGYVYQQTTDDRQDGNTLSGHRGRAVALGPSIRFDGGKWFVTAKYQKEFGVRNRAQGEGLVIKAVLPF
ncbi:SphA family protein [Ralstonia nicotianae]